MYDWQFSALTAYQEEGLHLDPYLPRAELSWSFLRLRWRRGREVPVPANTFRSNDDFLPTAPYFLPVSSSKMRGRPPMHPITKPRRSIV
jgi:hypothetical protein